MTQAELDALPECGGFDLEDIGNGMQRPVPRPSFALYTEDQDPCMVTDEHGQDWMIGRAHGRLWKRRIHCSG